MTVIYILLLVLMVIFVLFLFLKICLMKLSLRKLLSQAKEKIQNDSNIPLTSPSHDQDILRIAAFLTTELDSVLRAGRQYTEGNQEIKRAVMNVSHDLRTPLTSAAGYLGLLQKSGLNERQLEYVRILEGRIRAMKNLTEELLTFSVVASEEENIPLERTCINDCLEESLMQFYLALNERGIEPKISISEKRVYRYTNRETLSRIFDNILNNAVRYSDGDLFVDLGEEGKIVFKNTASKLDEVSVAKLFDRFFTVENARGATGLGLSIAKILTEKMNGVISAGWCNGQLEICLYFPDQAEPK